MGSALRPSRRSASGAAERVRFQYAKMCALRTSISRRGSPKKAPIRGHNLERTLPGRPVRLPVVPRHDQEQVMRIRRQVRLPQILEIVVVGGGSTALDLGDHSTPWPQTEEEVRSSLRHEAALRRQHHLFAEPSSTRRSLAKWAAPPSSWRRVRGSRRSRRWCREDVLAGAAQGRRRRRARRSAAEERGLHVPPVAVHGRSFAATSGEASWPFPPPVPPADRSGQQGDSPKTRRNRRLTCGFSWWSLGDSNP